MKTPPKTQANTKPTHWIPTHGTNNLPPPNQVVAVIYNTSDLRYPFRQFGHILNTPDRPYSPYWRLHGDPPGIITQPDHVTHWYPIPEMPQE